jgi:hypothetical protein
MSLTGIVLAYGAAHAPRLIAFSSVDPQAVSVSAASRVLSPSNDIHLQPVNLNYADRPQPSIVPVCKGQRVHLRLTHRVAITPRVLVPQRARENQMADEVVPPRIVVSNFPIDLNSFPLAVLVVFQGEQFGLNGPIFWKVTILHLTPAQQRAITGGVPKQI